MSETTQTIAALRQENRFFHLFTEEELAILQPLFTLNRCPAGESLLREGNPVGGPLSVVVSGALEIKKQTEFGRFVVLAKVTRGALLGYASIYQRIRPFPVTAVALEETTLLSLPLEPLKELLEQHPAIAVKILQEIIRVQDIRLQELVTRFTTTL